MKIIEPIGKGPNGGKQRELSPVTKTGQLEKTQVSHNRRNARHCSNAKSNKTAYKGEADFGLESFDPLGLNSSSNPKVNSKAKAGKVEGERSEKNSFKDLLHKAIHLLSMREHSKQELFLKLNNKEPNIDVVDEVMRFLSENDYVSDSRFTEAFVRAKSNKGQGPIKIRAQLKQKGVKDQVIQDYLDIQSGKWFDIAQTEYDKKYGELSVTDYNDWSKRARFLQSRGFTMDHIHCVVPQANFD